MLIFLGNLTVEELEERTRWNFDTRDKLWLEEHRQDDAKVKYESEKFHIFDIPFAITCDKTIFKELSSILKRYNDVQCSAEKLSISEIDETEEERKLKQKQKEREELRANPNAIWNIKWHMMVPVKVKSNKREIDCLYHVFINTYTRGFKNIPSMITGKGWVELDDVGLHGYFSLKNPETDDDANEHPEWNYVIGGNYFYIEGKQYHLENATFEKVEFDLAESIERFGDNYREIHFDKLAD